MTKLSFWTKYWGLTLDPFSEEPLQYNSENFEKLLVRYAPIQEVDDILASLYKERSRLMRKRYYVIGLRGMGKTTVLNYILHRTAGKPQEQVLSIYVNNVHVKDPNEDLDPAKDPEKLRLNFCLRTIEALFNTVLHELESKVSEQKYFEKVRGKYFELKGKSEIDQTTAESLLLEYLTRLKKDFDLFILLYDELDKIDEYDTVLRFLRSSQGLLETLSRYGCLIFLSGVPDFSKTLRSSEYSGVGGHEIWINTWSMEDAKSLIITRMEYAMFTGVFPFKDSVIQAICSRVESRPRLIQSQVRDALIWAAYNSQKVIDDKFIDKLVWDDSSVSTFKSDVKARKDLQEGVGILRHVYDPDRDDPAAFYLLMRIFKSVKLRPAALRDKHGIDMEFSQFERLIHLLKDFKAIVEGETEGTKFYALSGPVEHLFSYVKRTLDRSLEYLPRAIKVDLAEVRESASIFNLHNEIVKIFITNPQRRYTKSDLVKEILKNTDSKMKAMSYYKVARDSDLRSKLRIALSTALHYMKKEMSIIEVVKGTRISYQLSESVEEITWAISLRLDEDVLQNFQSAISTFKQNDLCGSIPLLRLSVENSLRHLAEICEIPPPEKTKLDTLGPINDRLYENKIYDQGLKTMIDAFKIEADPIAHGAAKLEDPERAKNLIERAELIIKSIYLIKKERAKQLTSSSKSKG